MTELEWTLRCDSADCAARVVARGVTDEACRRKVTRLAKELGWQSDERGDLCAECRAGATSAELKVMP